jgi:hypothetical protein
MMMLGKTRTAMMLMFALLTVEPLTFAQSARGFLGVRSNAAQPRSNCKTIRANGVQVFDPATGVVSGPVTNSGLLDGNLEDVIDFGAGFIFTPDPTVVAYTTALTITTNHGQLKASPVTIQSVLTGSGSEWGQIDPDTSTGGFAGATGTISVVFKPVGDPSVGPYEAEINADICFAQ